MELDGVKADEVRWHIAHYMRGNLEQAKKDIFHTLEIGDTPIPVLPSNYIVGDGRQPYEKYGVRCFNDKQVTKLDEFFRLKEPTFACVFSSFTLQDLDIDKAVNLWWDLVELDGVLILYHEKTLKNQILKSATFGEIEVDLDIGDNNLLVIRRGKARKSQSNKRACVFRLGAFGDLLQTSSILAGLKQAGYHVTIMTHREKSEVLQGNPNIDHWFKLERDQIPNLNLKDFFEQQNKLYDKFVQLSESVEGKFLALEGREEWNWSFEERDEKLNKNYLEYAHELAGIPHKPQIKFYPNLQEIYWVKNRIKKWKQLVNDDPVVVCYAMNGSSVHKVSPHMDIWIARILLKYKNVVVVLLGGEDSIILEVGWENEQRVIKTSGKWDIRHSLALAQNCDLLISPETGVANAVSCENVPKIILLSHSSHENLTRDWNNCVAFSVPREILPCSPCHRMIYGFHQCFRDKETGTAKCQALQPVNLIWQAIETTLDNNKKIVYNQLVVPKESKGIVLPFKKKESLI